MKKISKSKNNLVLYQAKNGAIEFRGDFQHETIWATQAQIVELFGVDQSVVSRHAKNIFKDGEIEEKSNMQKMHIANSDKPVVLYSLDVILSIGYRTNSKIAIEFRKWATKTLREYIQQGYVINKKQLLKTNTKNYEQFLKNVSDIQALLPENVVLDPKGILDLIKEYSVTWTNLDIYDRESFSKNGTTKKKVKLIGNELISAILNLKEELIKNGSATDIFANERREGSIEGIVGNVMQAFGGQDMYGTLEEKAAHLLYFIIKNHPFTDGNKRSGAFSFIWFLKKNGVKGIKNINPTGLTAMTILIAESDPKQKEKIVALVVELLRINKK